MTSKRVRYGAIGVIAKAVSGQCRIIDGGRDFGVLHHRMERWDGCPASQNHAADVTEFLLIVVARLKAQPPAVPRWTQQKHPSLIPSPAPPPSPVHHHHHHHGLDTVETWRFLLGVCVLGICCTSDEYDSG
jgi:hypothetical protein